MILTLYYIDNLIGKFMNYSPPNFFLWDTWYMPVGDLVHCYHLTCHRPGGDKTLDERWISHCVSNDLINWENRGQILGPDPDNPDDSNHLYTGCALWHNNRGYLYYCMRASQVEKQAMALATSDDGDTWTKHPHNPIITPDARWYARLNEPFAFQECRDLSIITHPMGGWIGYYAARLKTGRELVDTHCIACVRSHDLVHWEHLPPAFVPRKYNIAEVPEVFELNGLYYLTLLTGHYYGSRGLFSDPHVTGGTIYAIAERPEGPFQELDDNVLLGHDGLGPLSARTVMFEGQRHLMYSDHERIKHCDYGQTAVIGTLSTPKLLASSGQKLQALYCDRIESRVREEIAGPSKPPSWRQAMWRPNWPTMSNVWQENSDGSVTGQTWSGMDARIINGELVNGIIEVTLTIESGVAVGLALRQDDRGNGPTIVLNAKDGLIEYEDDAWFDAYRQRRLVPVKIGVPMHLRVILRGEHIEAYLDDVLYLAFGRYAHMDDKRFGLFVDRARGTFHNLRARTLDVTIPWRQ